MRMHVAWRRWTATRLGVAGVALAALLLWAHESGALGAAQGAKNPRFGVVHVGYGDRAPDAQRYQRASGVGLGTHRWAFYWNFMEPRPGEFNFASQERTVAMDLAHGLETLGILFGTPDWASTAPRPPAPAPSAAGPAPRDPRPLAARAAAAERQPAARIGPRPSGDTLRPLSTADPPISETVYPPRNLHLPVFADGTDALAPNKPANPENYWARFVQRVVAKFRGRVAYWEIWNEPDFRPRAESGWFGFWNGDARQYARLLKVAYLAAKSVDPQATIIMGGMMHWQDQSFFPQVLQALRADPDGARHGYFFDGTAWHWYSRASLAYDKTAWVRQQLERSGIGPKRIWITEANLPVCGDEAQGGLPRCEPGRHRGTPAQQAAFVVQAAAYSVAAAVERTLFFQYQDDELGPGDYYGLVRNNGTPRPALSAAQLVATHFRDIERVQRTVSAGGTIELIAMYRRDGQRIMVAWSTNGEAKKVSLPAETASATAINPAGQTRTIAAQGEGFAVELPPATLNDAPPGSPPDFIVGGEPVIIVERGVTFRQGTAAGTVRDQQGRPLANHPVRVGPAATTTDTNGRFSVTLPPGLYDIELGERTGYWQATPVLAVPVRGGATVERTVTARPVHVVRVPLVAKRGRP